jgi:hypothetical protein
MHDSMAMASVELILPDQDLRLKSFSCPTCNVLAVMAQVLCLSQDGT